jgi:hypothetical protein
MNKAQNLVDKQRSALEREIENEDFRTHLKHMKNNQKADEEHLAHITKRYNEVSKILESTTDARERG